MANFDGTIDPAASWPDVPQLSTDCDALGGPDGPLNAQAEALAARTKKLQADKADSSALGAIDDKADAALAAAGAAQSAADDAQTAAAAAETAADNAQAAAANALGVAGTAQDTANAAASAVGGKLDRAGGTSQQMTGQLFLKKGADIASAATVNLSTATGNTVHITGTTAITAFTMVAGEVVDVIFDGALTLTHHATNNNLPSGANITTAAGDRARYFYDGTTVWCMNYTRASGRPVAGGIIQGTAVATTSGMAIEYNGIPSGAKRISIDLAGFSTTGTSIPIVQLKTGGSPETSGYSGAASNVTTVVASTANTSGFNLASSWAAASAISGIITLELLDPATNTWVCKIGGAYTNVAGTIIGGGNKSLAGVLDGIRITTVAGTDTCDSGKANILVEV